MPFSAGPCMFVAQGVLGAVLHPDVVLVPTVHEHADVRQLLGRDDPGEDALELDLVHRAAVESDEDLMRHECRLLAVASFAVP